MVRRVGQRGRQRACRQPARRCSAGRARGARRSGLADGAGPHLQRIPAAHLDDEIGRLVGDPPPDVAALGPLGIVEETVDRREGGGGAAGAGAGAAAAGPGGGQSLGQRADQPPGALGLGRLRLEPADRVEHDAGASRIAVETADEHQPPFGSGEIEGRVVLEGEERDVVPRHARGAHRPRLAGDRGQRLERRAQVAGGPGGRLGARLRGSGEQQRQPRRRAGDRNPAHVSPGCVVHGPPHSVASAAAPPSSACRARTSSSVSGRSNSDSSSNNPV